MYEGMSNQRSACSLVSAPICFVWSGDEAWPPLCWPWSCSPSKRPLLLHGVLVALPGGWRFHRLCQSRAPACLLAWHRWPRWAKDRGVSSPRKDRSARSSRGRPEIHQHHKLVIKPTAADLVFHPNRNAQVMVRVVAASDPGELHVELRCLPADLLSHRMKRSTPLRGCTAPAPSTRWVFWFKRFKKVVASSHVACEEEGMERVVVDADN